MTTSDTDPKASPASSEQPEANCEANPAEGKPVEPINDALKCSTVIMRALTSRSSLRYVLVFLLAVLLSAVIAGIWLRIDKNPGDIATASFRKVTLTIGRPLTLQPEKDGLAELVTGFEVSNALTLSIQPCPYDKQSGHCVLTAENNSLFDVVVAGRAPEFGKKTAPRGYKIQPAIRALEPRQTTCAAKVELKALAGSDRGLTLTTRPELECDVQLETTIHEFTPLEYLSDIDASNTNDAAAAPRMAWEVRPKQGKVLINGKAPETWPLELGCVNSGKGATTASACRTVIDVRGQTVTEKGKPAQSPASITYHIRETREVVLLRDISELGPAVLALDGVLSLQDSTDASLWRCGKLAGDEWTLTNPLIRRLTLGGDDFGTLKASIQGYDDVCCSLPLGDFFTRFFGILGVPAIFEIVRWLMRRISR